jgi:hypothetical protein
MHADKKRRLITETQLFSILESNEDELLQAEAELGTIAGKILDGIYEPGMFARLVKAGAFQASTINVDDKPAFVMVHSRNALGWLIVEGVAALGKDSLQFVFDAGDALAKHFAAPTILWVTRLASLFRFGSRQGYKPMGVIMCKAI